MLRRRTLRAERSRRDKRNRECEPIRVMEIWKPRRREVAKFFCEELLLLRGIATALYDMICLRLVVRI